MNFFGIEITFDLRPPLTDDELSAKSQEMNTTYDALGDGSWDDSTPEFRQHEKLVLDMYERGYKPITVDGEFSFVTDDDEQIGDELEEPEGRTGFLGWLFGK